MTGEGPNQHGIGLVGCGGIAGTWIKAVDSLDQCRIELVHDLNGETARERASECGATAADLSTLLGSPDIDIVIICTPTPSHPDLTIDAASAGKHVLCEKPMALDLRSCRRMIASCEEQVVKLAIGHTLRFYSAFLTCRRLIDEGAIGTPVSGNIDRMGALQLRPAPALSATDGPETAATWRSDPALTGGHLLEGFIHEIDITRAVFGEVSTAMCELAGNTAYDGLMSPDLAEALVRFESGALVTMRAGGTVALPSQGYWFAGTEGGLRFAEWRGPVEHYRHDRDEAVLVSCDPQRAYAMELEDLLGAIETGGEPQNSGINGLKNIALGLGMYHSYETGCRVSFADGLPKGVSDDYRNTKW